MFAEFVLKVTIYLLLNMQEQKHILVVQVNTHKKIVPGTVKYN